MSAKIPKFPKKPDPHPKQRVQVRRAHKAGQDLDGVPTIQKQHAGQRGTKPSFGDLGVIFAEIPEVVRDMQHLVVRCTSIAMRLIFVVPLLVDTAKVAWRRLFH